jgi:hypothetical protein
MVLDCDDSQIQGRYLLEALNKDLSLSLDSGRIRLCEALCGADAALFRDSFSETCPFSGGSMI